MVSFQFSKPSDAAASAATLPCTSTGPLSATSAPTPHTASDLDGDGKLRCKKLCKNILKSRSVNLSLKLKLLAVLNSGAHQCECTSGRFCQSSFALFKTSIDKHCHHWLEIEYLLARMHDLYGKIIISLLAMRLKRKRTAQVSPSSRHLKAVKSYVDLIKAKAITTKVKSS